MLLLPAVFAMMEKDPVPVLQAVRLSDTAIKLRIDEMDANIEEQLCVVLRKTSFSFELDKTTTSDNNALLTA